MQRHRCPVTKVPRAGSEPDSSPLLSQPVAGRVTGRASSPHTAHLTSGSHWSRLRPDERCAGSPELKARSLPRTAVADLCVSYDERGSSQLDLAPLYGQRNCGDERDAIKEVTNPEGRSPLGEAP